MKIEELKEGMDFKGNKKVISNNEQLEIQYENNDYSIFYKEENADDMKNSFEPSEFENYLKKLPFNNPRWIMLKYNNVSILRRIVSEKEFPTDIIIDCDGVDSKSTDLPVSLILFQPCVLSGITRLCGTNGRKLFMDFAVFLPFCLPLSTEFQELLPKCSTCYCIFSPLYHTAFYAVLFSVSGLLLFSVSPF